MLYSGNLNGSGLKIGIVVGRFNDLMSSRLLAGAEDALVRHGVAADDIDVAWVPGAFEIPAVTQKLIEKGGYDAIVALGVVIRGATSHYDLVTSEVAKGVAKVGLDSGVPVSFGLVTTDSIEQALERAGSKSGNKGADAAVAAIEMANLYKAIK